eukprot:jgi/Chrzof1/8305/Cz03g05170.t1
MGKASYCDIPLGVLEVAISPWLCTSVLSASVAADVAGAFVNRSATLMELATTHWYFFLEPYLYQQQQT